MADALMEEFMSTSLLRVVERARREPEGRFHSLAHLIDVPALERAFHRLRTDAAVGVDGVSKEQYGQALEANLEDLHGRLRTKRYRHQPLRRVHIPKGGGRTRPIGISAVEDKIVQGAVREVLEYDKWNARMAFKRCAERSAKVLARRCTELREPTVRGSVFMGQMLVFWSAESFRQHGRRCCRPRCDSCARTGAVYQGQGELDSGAPG